MPEGGNIPPDHRAAPQNAPAKEPLVRIAEALERIAAALESK